MRVNLRKAAQGEPCLVRVPFACDGGGPTTVLAHIRRANVAGIGQKPPDICAVRACARCHDIIDGRAPLPELVADHIDSIILAALVRTLAAYVKEGIL